MVARRTILALLFPLSAGCGTINNGLPYGYDPGAPSMITVGEPENLPKSTVVESCFGDAMSPPRQVASDRVPNDEWDFLRPAAKLAEPGAMPSTVWTTLRPPR